MRTRKCAWENVFADYSTKAISGAKNHHIPDRKPPCARSAAKIQETKLRSNPPEAPFIRPATSSFATRRGFAAGTGVAHMSFKFFKFLRQRRWRRQGIHNRLKNLRYGIPHVLQALTVADLSLYTASRSRTTSLANQGERRKLVTETTSTGRPSSCARSRFKADWFM